MHFSFRVNPGQRMRVGKTIFSSIQHPINSLCCFSLCWKFGGGGWNRSPLIECPTQLPGLGLDGHRAGPITQEGSFSTPLWNSCSGEKHLRELTVPLLLVQLQ